MNAIRAAIYAVLEADRVSTAAGSLGTLGVTAIYDEVGPKGAQVPYVIVHETPGAEIYTMGATLAMRQRRHVVKAVDLSDGTAIDTSRAGAIDERCAVLLDDAFRKRAGLTPARIAVTGYTTVAVTRQHPFAANVERSGQVESYAGAEYEVLVQ
jgi:hypothetical protein